MPCCHIPNPAKRVFPASLIADANRFAEYVGGAPLAQIGAPAPTTVVTSALHLEMKLWKPTQFRRPLVPNDVMNNAWLVMRRRTTAPQKIYPRFNANERDGIFALVDINFALRADQVGQSCVQLMFDKWALEAIDGLRGEGLSHAGLTQQWRPNAQGKPPELATIGLAQKLINIFLKYEICWQVSGQWVNGEPDSYNLPKMEHLSKYLCALHAPIDRIFLHAIRKTALGKWISGQKVHSGLHGPALFKGQNLIPSSGSPPCPWSKLDCLRTYYGLQLMLRQVAMHTWDKGCACNGSAVDSIRPLATWFEKQYGQNFPCGEGQIDWVAAACDLPEEVIEATTSELFNNL